MVLCALFFIDELQFRKSFHLFDTYKHLDVGRKTLFVKIVPFLKFKRNILIKHKTYEEFGRLRSDLTFFELALARTCGCGRRIL